MSRSKRKPAHYTCTSSHSKEGKQVTSRTLRRKTRQLIHIEEDEFDFTHLQDRNRGKAGSKDIDWGSTYFGDGIHNPYRVAHHIDDEEVEAGWYKKLHRK